MPGETVPQTATILKSYFQTGNFPTAEQFAEFVDTMFYLYNDALNQAQTDATNALNTALAGEPNVIAAFTLGLGFAGPGPALVGSTVGVASWNAINQSGIQVTLVVNFTKPFANLNYKI